MGEKNLENMRDCVRLALEKGSERGYEFKKMRHAIIFELKRLGFSYSEIKDKLLEWNQRCERILPQNEARRQLFNYVDWFSEQEAYMGCKAIEDFCVGKDKCTFHRKKVYINNKQFEKSPFDFREAERFLEKRYRADALPMMLILKCLRHTQIEKATGETVLLGFRGIAKWIRDNYRHSFDAMAIFRKTQDLMSEGMIEIVIKGTRGHFKGKANGYRFLPWRAPKERPGV